MAECSLTKLCGGLVRYANRHRTDTVKKSPKYCILYDMYVCLHTESYNNTDCCVWPIRYVTHMNSALYCIVLSYGMCSQHLNNQQELLTQLPKEEKKKRFGYDFRCKSYVFWFFVLFLAKHILYCCRILCVM